MFCFVISAEKECQCNYFLLLPSAQMHSSNLLNIAYYQLSSCQLSSSRSLSQFCPMNILGFGLLFPLLKFQCELEIDFNAIGNQNNFLN